MSSRDLSIVVKTQKAFIKELLDRLAQREEDRCLNLISENFFMSINGSVYPLEQIKKLLNDPYFNGLTLEQILDLAKKSIRLTNDNCKMRHNLEDIEEMDGFKLFEEVVQYNITMCGYGPVMTTIDVSKSQGKNRCEILSYQTSGDVTGDLTSVVGYASGVFK